MAGNRYTNEQQRIIEVAGILVGESGLGSFRIESLSERLGYTRQNIYRYFPNKKAILSAVIVEGSRSVASRIAGELESVDLPYDEQLIEGILIACDYLRGENRRGAYAGEQLAYATRLFMENADAVQQVMLEFLEPLLAQAKSRGELYLSMGYEDIAGWLFQVALSEMLCTEYQDRESRRQFLLKMFSPSINAKKARANVTIEDVHRSHIKL